MLSRTADHLYWMARYIERAENMARALDVTYRMSLVHSATQNDADIWRPPILATGDIGAYSSIYQDYNAKNVLQYIAFDKRNPSSIVNTLERARENARAVRVAMSSEMWENVNALWLELQPRLKDNLREEDINEFCDWIKSRSHLFRGVTVGTMLRDDAYQFVRLGTFIERADNTARLLDVKYHLLLPSGEEVGGAVDYYEWSALLRSVSALETYQKVYRDTIEPWRVAELLVLRHDMPRSLHACFDEIMPILERLCGNLGYECLRQAGELRAKLHYGRMENIFQNGLHEFLDDFVGQHYTLSKQIQDTFFDSMP